MRNLQEFQSEHPANLFPLAPHLPPFFQTNLLDPARVVKAFYNDPQANIRIFYYQYLKLCFEIENSNYQFYIQRIEEIINNETFKFIFLEEDDASIFNDIQFKKLIMDFFGVLGTQNMGLQQALNRNHIMDTVFIYFFRSLLILTGKAESIQAPLDRNQLFQFLSSYFSVELSIHDNCIKFVETDIFVYEEDPREVYMAYMDYTQTQQAIATYQQDPQHQPIIQNKMPQVSTSLSLNEPQNQPNTNTLVVQQNERGNTLINQSYIADQFMDYTDSKKQGLSSLLKSQNRKTSGFHDNNSAPTFNDIISTELKSNQNSVSNKSQDASSNFGKHTFEDTTKPQPPTYPQYKYQVNNSFLPAVLPNKESAQIHNKSQEAIAQTNNISYQPTKDPGFLINSNFQPKINTYQPSIVPKPVVDQYSQNQYQSSQNQYQSIQYNQGQYNKNEYSSQYLGNEAQYKKPSSYDPSKYLESIYGNEQKKPQSSYDQVKAYESKPYEGIKAYDQIKTSFESTKPYDQIKQESYLPSINRKNPYGLNVSNQFTNSQTMKAMAEPYKSNVAAIRTRARAFRNSLVTFIK